MKNKLTLSLIIFFTSFFLYLHTISPTINVGDSGEFISASYTLGIAHPPGYPMQILMGKIFSLLPVGNIAFRINLVSAFFTSIAVVLLFIFLDQLISMRLIAFAGSLIFAVTRTLWAEAIISEVYALNIAIVLILLICINKHKLFLGFFLIGLGCCIHLTALLFLPIFLLIYYKEINEKKIYTAITFILLFFIGISLYLSLLIRAYKMPSINFGNPQDLSALLKHFLRKEYTPFSRIYSLEKSITHISHYFSELREQFPIFLLTFAPFGIWNLSQKKSKWLLYSIIIFLLTTLSFILPINYEINLLNFYLIKVFYIPSYVIFLFWILEGVIFINHLIRKKINISEIIIACILILSSIFLIYKNYFFNNNRLSYSAYNYGEDLLITLPKDSYLITKGDNQLFSLFYFKLVENRRKDIIIDPRQKGYIFKTNFENKKNQNTFFAEKKDAILIRNINLIPIGLVYSYNFDTTKKSFAHLWNYYKNSNLESKKYFFDYLTNDILIKYKLQYAENLYNEGKYNEAYIEYTKAINLGADFTDDYFEFALNFFSLNEFDKAIYEFKKIILINPEYSKAYNYLGASYAQKNDFINAINSFKTAISKSPKNISYKYNLALAYIKNGDLNLAKENLTQILEENPEHKQARELLTSIK